MDKKFSKPVSMIMVVYNEEDHIKGLIESYYKEIYCKLTKGSEFIIYLDKPTDNTPIIVNELAKRINIKVINAKVNLGYAGALTNAFKATKNSIIFYSDSSGKHIAKDFWKLIKYENDYDIISGLRTKREDPILRRIVTHGQRLMVSLLFFIPLHDFNTGYKIIHRNIVKNVVGECKYMKQSFSSELLIRAYKKGYSIKSVPVTFKKRKKKNTGTSYRNLPSIIARSFLGFLLLRFELFFKKRKRR